MSTDDKKALLGCGILILGIPLLFGGCYAGSNVETSTGFRDSTIRKVSESGIVFKTWEVETLGDGMRGSGTGDSLKIAPETFKYSVSSRELAESLQNIPAGKRVRIHYRANLTPWYPKGYSKYFIVHVESLD